MKKCTEELDAETEWAIKLSDDDFLALNDYQKLRAITLRGRHIRKKSLGMRKKFIKIKSISQGSFYIENFETDLQLCGLLGGADAGEENGYIVSIVEMTQEEYDALPKFTRNSR